MIGSQIFNDQFSEDNLQLIARGGFSQIFITECNITKELIVIKKMKSDDEQTLNFLSQEANCIKRLNDETLNLQNIIKIYSHTRINNCVYIAMEYCRQGSLERLLNTNKKLNLYEIIILAKQMISALLQAHRMGLVHSDLKPENVLIRSQNEYVLTDWGSAQQLSHQHSTTLRDNTYFTPGYQAPELQNENLISSNMKYNYFIADIYSLGMMLLRCTGPSFREIRTISSEADQNDHDWKINKLFKSYIYQKEYQDGVIDKIIGGFLNYCKPSRLKLEDALSLINSSYPNIESYFQQNNHHNAINSYSQNQTNVINYDIKKNSNDNNCMNSNSNSSNSSGSYNSNNNQKQNGLEQNLEDSIPLSRLNISSQKYSNPDASATDHNQQYNNNYYNTILKKYQSSNHGDLFSSFNAFSSQNNDQLIDSNQSNNNTNIFKSPMSYNSQHQNSLQMQKQQQNNVINGIFHQGQQQQQQQLQQNKISDFCSISLDNNSDNSNISSSNNSSGTGSNQSSKKMENDNNNINGNGMNDSKINRQSIREKRNKSNEKLRINKNISISYLSELIKLNSDVDNFKAYLSNQINDGNVCQLAQRLQIADNLKKLLLCIGGCNDFSDNCIYQIQNALQNKKLIHEFNFDISNSSKASLRAINYLLKGIPQNNIETLSLSLSKINISEGDFDEFVDVLFNMITEDDIDFICEHAEDNENIDKFYLICPKNSINDEKADSLEKQLSESISDVKITISS